MVKIAEVNKKKKIAEKLPEEKQYSAVLKRLYFSKKWGKNDP